jgi:hypothetical protein
MTREWKMLDADDIILEAGTQTVRISVEEGSLNMKSIEFSAQK